MVDGGVRWEMCCMRKVRVPVWALRALACRVRVGVAGRYKLVRKGVNYAIS